MTERGKKKAQKHKLKLLEIVIRLQHISIRALTSSKALKTSHTVLTTVTASLCEH